MKQKLKEIVWIFIFSLVPTLLVWLPFLLRLPSFWGIPLPGTGMATIVANYDGPLYLVVAKTFYNSELIKSLFSFPLPVEYYASHFPLFPALIKAFSFVFGYPYAMLFVTISSSILTIFFFHKFIKQYAGQNALWVTFLFSIFPARWLIVRSVGSPEPLFLAAIIACVYYFQNKKFWLAGIWGAVALLTKSPGILLFVGLAGSLALPKLKELSTKMFAKSVSSIPIKKGLPILLIPLSLVAVFVIYKIQLNDFFAYFHSGDNIHLIFPPFSIFNYTAPWVGTFWIEEVTFIYLVGALGLFKLIQRGENLIAWVMGTFFVSLLFVAHRDLMRYSLPIIPFLFVSFSETITKKEFRLAFLIILIPIYLFSLAYISGNIMPISNWGPFL